MRHPVLSPPCLSPPFQAHNRSPPLSELWTVGQVSESLAGQIFKRKSQWRCEHCTMCTVHFFILFVQKTSTQNVNFDFFLTARF